MPRIATALSPERLQASSAFLEPLAYHDTRRNGFVALAFEGPTVGWDHEWVPLERFEERLLEPFTQGVNWYVSQAEFFRKSRTVVSVKRLGLSFVDLDTYKIPLLKELSAESQLALFLQHCDDAAIPEPSMVVYSGRGLQAKWCYSSSVPSTALPRWQAVQRELCERLKKFGADAGALDPSRVLRLVGTTHQTSRQEARVVHRARAVAMGGEWLANGLVGYDFEEFAKTLLPRERPEKPRESAQLYALPDVAGRPSLDGRLRSLSARSLAWDRLQDLFALAELRFGDSGVPGGWRDRFVFLGAAFLAQYVGSLQAFDRQLEDLMYRLAPAWEASDLQSCICTVKSRYLDAAHGKRAQFLGTEVDPRYRFRTQTLIQWLEITAAEQLAMRTIIGPDEKRRRGRERKAAQREQARASGVLTTRAAWQQEHAERAALAKQLRARGLPWAVVARHTGHASPDAARMAAGSVKH